jgi:protein gp37
MAKGTPIQWSDDTINPVMGCNGCELWDAVRRSCYAGILHGRYGGVSSGYAPSFEQVTRFPGRMAHAAKWPDLLGRMRPEKPWLTGSRRLIFVSDMGDSFSSEVSFEFLDAEVITAVMSLEGQRHAWLWLTKRPGRMAQFSRWLTELGCSWPENLWAGTSITSKATLGRIDALLRVGNASTRRFLSVEPQVEALSLMPRLPKLDWVIQGGESGESPRVFDLDWARSLLVECERSGVPYFLKQLGACPVEGGRRLKLRDRHGGDWREWPEELRRRQVPDVDFRRSRG